MIEYRLLTPAQIAEVLQLNERTVTQWLRKGRLRGFKVGKEWRISRVDPNNFLEERANVPPRDHRTEQVDSADPSRKVRATK